MGHSKITYYVIDEGGTYNIITSADFDDNGRYIPDKASSLEDFEIIERFTNFKRACEFCNEINKQNNST